MADVRSTEIWPSAVVYGIRHAGRGLAAAALVLGAAACTEGEGPYRLPPPPTEAERAEFGQVGLVVAAAAEPENNMPVGEAEEVAGGAVAGGAAMGAAGVATMALYPPVLAGAVIFPPLALVGVAVAVGAAAAGFGGAKVLVPENIKQDIDALVLAEWAEFEAASGAQLRLATAAAGDTSRPAANAPMPAAAAAGIDSVLTIQVTHLGLAGRGGSDPILYLVVSIEATLASAGGEKLHGLKLSYVGPPYNFSHWRADEGQALQDEFERAFGAIGERVHEELFLLWLPQPAAG